MSGIDKLLAKSLEEVLRSNLGKDATLKIEKRLLEKFGISFADAIEQFDKIDNILREFFGSAAIGLEKKYLYSICKIKMGTEKNWYTIQDRAIAEIVAATIGDSDKSKIVSTINNESKIISHILHECGIPQTSGYRKIHALLNSGMIETTSDFVYAQDGRKIYKYKSTFDKLRINVVNEKLTVDVQLKRPNFNGSNILKVIFG